MDLLNKTIDKVITKDELVQQLHQLGVRSNMVLEVHTALSAFGYVVGGAQAVVDAYLECVGYEGTLVMPMQDADNSDPTIWEHPPIDHDLHQIIRDHTPAFNKKESDGKEMGKVADNFRRRDGVIISNNPSLAYAAWGRYAKLICDRHALHFSLGEESPIAKMVSLQAYVLMVGVPYSKCTCLHLAEYRSGYRPIVLQGAAVEINGRRAWKKYLDVDVNSDIFNEVGAAMEPNIWIQKAKIGEADCRLFRMDEAIDFTTNYLQNK